MAITFHPDGRVTGSGASNFGASSQVLQSITKMDEKSCFDVGQWDHYHKNLENMNFFFSNASQ